MNILLINHYAGSTEMGMEFRPYYFSREWVKAGHHVDIIAGDYSHLRRQNPHVEQDFQKEEIDGISYHWIRTGEYEGNGVKRAFTMFRFVGKLWFHAGKIVKEMRPDVVIASSTYPLDTYAAQRIAKKAGAQLIHEVHDMWPATLIELGGMSKGNPFVVLMQIAENSAYKHSDKVVSLPPCAKEYMVQHGLQPEKFVHISNGIIKEEWEHPAPLPEEHQQLLTQLKKQGKFIVGYFGGHALSNALQNLIQAAQMVQNDKIVFVLVGNGVEKPGLQEYVRKNGMSNVYFLPPIVKEGIPTLIQQFDCIYMGLHKSSLYRFGICMNKLFDSMMAGKPILYAVDSPDNCIERYQCGYTVDPEQPQQYVDALEQIITLDKEKRQHMGQNGRQAVLEHFEYSMLANDFLNIMKKRGQ